MVKKNFREINFFYFTSFFKPGLLKKILALKNLDILQGKVQKPLTGIDWKRYPKELAPSTIKKSKRTTTAKVRTDVKRKKLTDTAILDKLEKNEENEEKDDDDETSNPGGSVTNFINFLFSYNAISRNF